MGSLVEPTHTQLLAAPADNFCPFLMPEMPDAENFCPLLLAETSVPFCLLRAEAAFRDLKDPAMIATRPQFHWTDQKLRVHAFVCVLAYLLERLLWWRLRQRTDISASPRTILAQLKKIRMARIVEMTGKAGRPRLRYQLEEMDADLRQLAELTGALPEQ